MDGALAEADELVPSTRGLAASAAGRLVDADVDVGVGVETAALVLRVPAGAVFGRDSDD